MLSSTRRYVLEPLQLRLPPDEATPRIGRDTPTGIPKRNVVMRHKVAHPQFGKERIHPDGLASGSDRRDLVIRAIQNCGFHGWLGLGWPLAGGRKRVVEGKRV